MRRVGAAVGSLVIVALACSRRDAVDLVPTLNNTPHYAARLRIALANYKPEDVRAAYALKWEYDCMRQYAKAEEVCDALMAKAGRRPELLIDQSCYVGKQGRLPQALALAEEALKSTPEDMRGRLVSALWLTALGQHQDAQGAIASVDVPERTVREHTVYWLCMAYIRARKSDEEGLKQAIDENLRNDPQRWAFDCYQRDVTFDPFRLRPWFIELVGKTLGPPNPRMERTRPVTPKAARSDRG